MGLFNLEEKVTEYLEKFKERLTITTEIVDNDKEFLMVTKSYFNSTLIDTYELDLDPLVEGIRKRLT